MSIYEFPPPYVSKLEVLVGSNKRPFIAVCNSRRRLSTSEMSYFSSNFSNLTKTDYATNSSANSWSSGKSVIILESKCNCAVTTDLLFIRNFSLVWSTFTKAKDESVLRIISKRSFQIR